MLDRELPLFLLISPQLALRFFGIQLLFNARTRSTLLLNYSNLFFFLACLFFMYPHLSDLVCPYKRYIEYRLPAAARKLEKEKSDCADYENITSTWTFASPPTGLNHDLTAAKRLALLDEPNKKVGGGSRHPLPLGFVLFRWSPELKRKLACMMNSNERLNWQDNSGSWSCSVIFLIDL